MELSFRASGVGRHACRLFHQREALLTTALNLLVQYGEVNKSKKIEK